MNWDWTLINVSAVVILNTLVLWVWKPWTQAYAGEKGKNLARKEDLAEIVTEIRAVTIAQKEIEAKVSGEVWRSQWLLNQKLETYSRLLRAVHDYMMCLSDVVDAQWGAGKTTDKQWTQVADEFFAAFAVSPLFLSAESNAILQKALPKFTFHSVHSAHNDGVLLVQQASRDYESLGEARASLIETARRDLAG